MHGIYSRSYLRLWPVLMLLLSACAMEVQEIEKPHSYIQSIGMTPISLFKQVRTCSNAPEGGSEQFYDVLQFLQGEESRRELNLSHLLQDGSVTNLKSVSAVVYDADVIFQRYIDGPRVIGQEFLVKGLEENKLFVCPEVRRYKRYSYENAGLSIAYSITKTADRLESYGIESAGPVTVYLSSNAIERLSEERSREIVHQDKTITDNAYYVAHLNAIVFLPQSEESVSGERFGNVALWELPLVASHEYGHHVFAGLVGNREMLVNHSYQYESRLQTSRGKVSKLLGAINEAFADMVAYYTLDPHEVSLKGIACMQYNREVGSRSFANGEYKKLSSEVLESFWSGNSGSRGGCFNPDYTQLHSLGAILANTFEVLVTHIAGQSSRAALRSSEQKMQILAAWVRELAARHKNLQLQGEAAYLADAYALFVKELRDDSEDRFSWAECGLIRELAPEVGPMDDKLMDLGC